MKELYIWHWECYWRTGLQKEQPQEGFKPQEHKPLQVSGDQLYEERAILFGKEANEEREMMNVR